MDNLQCRAVGQPPTKSKQTQWHMAFPLLNDFANDFDEVILGCQG